MMMKKKSNPWSRTKVLYVVPAAMLALSVFATTEFKNSVNVIDDTKVSNLVSDMSLKSTDFVSLVTKNTESTPTKVNVPSVEKEIKHAEPNAPTSPVTEQPMVKDTAEVYAVVETAPEYPGGQEGMFRYLAKNLKYPVEAASKGITGRVLLQLIINENGNIADVKVIKSAHPLLDAEAIRCVRGMEKWKPGTLNGEPVGSTYPIPVFFRLNSKTPSQEEQKEESNVPTVTVTTYR